jgi:peroxiredoxin
MVLMQSNYSVLKKNDFAIDFSLKGTDDKIHSLNEIKGSNFTLIVFMCNHCPYVIPKLDELNKLNEKITVIGINPNDSEKYPADSFENMKKLPVNFIYLRDKTQEIAKAYGAVCTPDPFLFDKDLKLIYHGRIDDIEKALSSDIKEVPSQGCSIKWK